MALVQLLLRKIQTTRWTISRSGASVTRRAKAKAKAKSKANEGEISMTPKSKKAITALDTYSKERKFVRKESTFRRSVGEEGFPAEKGRYHLYVSLACPWATRCLQFRNLKGLEHVLEVSFVHPTWERTRPDDPEDTHCGWVFDPKDESKTDGLNGCRSIRDLYDLAVRGEYTASTFTTPVLWCSKEKTIVNNESSEICRMLNKEFDAFAARAGLDLYPDRLEKKIRELEKWIYHDINNGVYKSGFARSQEAYDEAVTKLFEALERVESILSQSRYLCGDALTGIDIWLFNTLIRFDAVYVVYFKCSKKCIREFPNMFNYMKEIYQASNMVVATNVLFFSSFRSFSIPSFLLILLTIIFFDEQIPEIHKTIDFKDIRTHYFTSHSHLNPFRVVPISPHVDLMESHDRERAYPAPPSS